MIKYMPLIARRSKKKVTVTIVINHTHQKRVSRDQYEYELSQWETTLQCNVVSYWMSPYPEWSLCFWSQQVRNFMYGITEDRKSSSELGRFLTISICSETVVILTKFPSLAAPKVVMLTSHIRGLTVSETPPPPPPPKQPLVLNLNPLAVDHVC